MTIDAHYPSMDDASLAYESRTDPQAFAELYRRHVRSIYRYRLAHTGNVKDAEDLTSQTFITSKLCKLELVLRWQIARV